MKGKAAERSTSAKATGDKTETQAKVNGDDRSIEVTAQTAMAAESLKGDVRDALLTEIKGLSKPWAKMAEHEQERVIHRCRTIAGDLVHRVVRITASRGFDHMPVSIGKFSVDVEKGIQCSFAMPRSRENLIALGNRLGSVVLLVPMDIEVFMGERKPAEPENVGELGIPKTGPGAPSDPAAESKVGRGNRIAEAVKAFGIAVPLTEDEIAKGIKCAFEKDGNRVSFNYLPGEIPPHDPETGEIRESA